ncbi:MAG: nicotinate (nicotinamide) nucleotide adenylyltransferase [Bacteroidetes bacterium]|nr:nicotinate (nicotinamide) nucleotide adenylyltransferase [Bacteroidota bacterium]
MQNIGIFGGTFDPFHIGHLTIVECFIEKCSLDECFIVPAKCSPFKIYKDNLYTDNERIKIIEKHIKGIKKIQISLYEINNSNPVSYAVDTLNYYKNKYNGANIFLLIGYDAAINFSEWKDYKMILDIAKIVIANRSEYNNKELLEHIFTNGYIELNNPNIDISSTDIRKNIIF